MDKKNRKEYATRTPSKIEAFSCLAVIFAVIILFVQKGVNISVALLVSTLYILLIGLICGYSAKELLATMLEKAAGLTDLYVLILGIGFLVASLVYSGAIPTLICYLMGIVTPGMCIFLGFVLTALTAFFIGTSFGTAGTMGIIMISLGLALDANMPLLAGAVVSGSHVGLFLSPLSDNFNLTVSLGKEDTRTTMKRAFYVGAPMLVLCIAFYLIMGFASGNLSGNTEGTENFIIELKEIFHITPIALLPIIYVLAASFLKMPAIFTLFSGGFIGIILGWLLNGFSIFAGFQVLYSGFNINVVTGIAETDLMPEILTLCNRGGMLSMVDLLIIIIPAMCMSGIMIKIGVVQVVVSLFLGNVKSAFGLAVWSWIIGSLTAITTSASAISIIMPFEMLEKKYEELGYSKLDCAVICNTTASPIMSLTPWSDVGVYMSSVVGISTLAYLPYCIWCWGLGAMGIVCSIFKLGYQKKESVNRRQTE